jgi:hypothetical protein
LAAESSEFNTIGNQKLGVRLDFSALILMATHGNAHTHTQRTYVCKFLFVGFSLRVIHVLDERRKQYIFDGIGMVSVARFQCGVGICIVGHYTHTHHEQGDKTQQKNSCNLLIASCSHAFLVG